jgi:hypothetical protein
LAGLEIAARLFHWRPDTFFQPDERFGYFHVPNADGWWVNIDAPGEFQTRVRINSLGLRDREYPYEKPPGVFRILVLGDSFADALEVSLEDSFQEVLESLLNERPDRPIEVVNGGVWGYGNDLELLFYRLEGRKYQPDLVLLAFQSTSDVLENHREMETRYMGREYKPFFVLRDGDLELVNFPFRVEPEPPPRGVVERAKRFLAAHSRLYHVAGRFVKVQMRGLTDWLREIRVVDPAQGNAVAEDIPMAMYLYAVDYSPEWEEAWTITRAIITQLKREVEADGARLAVVLLPDRHQVEGDYLAWALRTYPAMQSQVWDLDKPNCIMREFLAQEGIPVMEMLDEFRTRTDETGQPLYYPKDGHWNVEGHHLAGELLAEKLCQQGLVPCEEGEEAKGTR